MSIDSLQSFQEACAKPESVDYLDIDTIPAKEAAGVDWNLLGTFTNLTRLELSEVPITTLPASLASLTKLKSVTLKKTPKLDWDQAFRVLAKIPTLEYLELKLQSKLVTIPDSIGELSQLKSLSLYQSGAKTLPASLFKLVNLENLYLQFGSIPTLPDELGELSNLVDLELSSIDLTELPSSIGKLKKLTRLGLQGNKLKALPDTIGELTELADLDLSRNAIKDLPKSFGQLQKLAGLDYTMNKLKKLPTAICELSALAKLFLTANDLAELPEKLGELPIEKLYVRGNKKLDPDKTPAKLRPVADFS